MGVITSFQILDKFKKSYVEFRQEKLKLKTLFIFNREYALVKRKI